MGNLHEDLCTFMIVFLLNFCENEKCFSQKLLRQPKPTFYVRFFPKIMLFVR